jgi:hypothetical protein
MHRWQRGYDKLTMVNLPGATGPTYDDPTVFNTTITRYYRRIAYGTMNGLTCSDMSNTVSVAAGQGPIASASNKSVCKGGVVALSGSPNGGSWSGPE